MSAYFSNCLVIFPASYIERPNAHKPVAFTLPQESRVLPDFPKLLEAQLPVRTLQARALELTLPPLEPHPAQRIRNLASHLRLPFAQDGEPPMPNRQ